MMALVDLSVKSCVIIFYACACLIEFQFEVSKCNLIKLHLIPANMSIHEHYIGPVCMGSTWVSYNRIWELGHMDPTWASCRQGI